MRHTQLIKILMVTRYLPGSISVGGTDKSISFIIIANNNNPVYDVDYVYITMCECHMI